MTRDQLEHILRAASAITKQGRFVVVGSQSILGAIPEPPGVLGYSAEADIYPLDAPELSDLIDGSIGEGSPFHETFGYYAQGVGPETAVLPDGWQHRLNQVRDPVTLADGFCLDPTDMAASKLVAWREKDQSFLAAMLESKMIDHASLEQRALQIPSGRLAEYGLSHEDLTRRVCLVGLASTDAPMQERYKGSESAIEAIRSALPSRKKSKGLDR